MSPGSAIATRGPGSGARREAWGLARGACGLRLAVLVLTVAALWACGLHPAWAELGQRPPPRARADLELLSPPEIGEAFRVQGSLRAHVALRLVRAELELPSGVVLQSGGQSVAPRLEAGQKLEVPARLRITRGLEGAELKVVFRFEEDGAAAREPLTLSHSIFLTVTESDGGEGLPGSFWLRATRPPPRNLPAGFLLADLRPADDAEPEDPLRVYFEAADDLDRGKSTRAVSLLETLVDKARPELVPAVLNALAAARALGGDAAAARKGWQALLARDDLPLRCQGYVHYNVALLALLGDDPATAMEELSRALAAHPGFRLAGKLRGQLEREH